MNYNNIIDVFFTLVKAGLWEKDTRLPFNDEVDFAKIYNLAEEQSVIGLLAAGFEQVVDTKIPKQELLQFVGTTLQLEERNKAMNHFVQLLVKKLCDSGIHAVLIKGQGIAQCYERPLWRSAGDIDLFLDCDNYEKAKKCLCRYAVIDNEDKKRLHLGMTIDGWLVELHGTMHTDISPKLDFVIDEVQRDIFLNGGVRSWNNSGIEVFLPNPDNDAIIVFSHFINHFYEGGIGLRQICDWCRLLWTFREEIDRKKLEKRLNSMRLMAEWKAFSAFAVEYLGMPVEATPFYDNKNKWRRKASVLKNIMIETGDLGKNVDDSYRNSSKRLKKNVITFWVRLKEFSRLTLLFPHNSPRFFVYYVFNRMKNKRVI